MVQQPPIPLIFDGRDVILDGLEFPVISSAQKRVVSFAQGASPKAAVEAVESAQKAFPLWKLVKPQEKRRLLQRYGELIQARGDELVRAMVEETSCTEDYAKDNVRTSLSFIFETAALATAQALEGSIPSTTAEECLALVLHEPLGVILSIAPWNAALILGVRAFLGPLVAGNTIVVKVTKTASLSGHVAYEFLEGSELSPKTHYLMIKAIQEAGFPPGVVNLIQHRPEDASIINTVMIAHRAVRKVTFTGSAHVGAIIAATAAQHLKPTLMELGGKCPMIVLEDADLEQAARAAVVGAFLNSGQICMSTESIIVVNSVTDRLIPELLSALEHFPKPTVSVTENGANRTNALIEDSLHKGGAVITETRSPLQQGASIPPTIIRGLNPEMRLFTEESFGPCLGIIEVENAAEAINVANASFYGLSASVFSQDVARALAVAKKLESGAVHINAPTLHDEATLPHGGVKDSGYGRFGGRWGLSEFVKTKNIMVHGVSA